MNPFVGHGCSCGSKGAHQGASHHWPGFFQTLEVRDPIGQQSTHSGWNSSLGHGTGQFLDFRMLDRDGLPNLHLPRQRKFLAQGGHFLAQQINDFMVSLLLIRHGLSLCSWGSWFRHRQRGGQWREGRIDTGRVHHWRSHFVLGRSWHQLATVRLLKHLSKGRELHAF